ncbi:hypothetical protein SCLCIDRAFT_1220863 [Scleroderma citrinum Foug A]|uniref:Uncharacterized protein n=1 Tax=Scleroderma citrinum Foug A TaxID=1036808 RepID=A0A0C3DIH6_9AGAM|nr:hypothetical protein SCLCIDRAFT_1220863 [Scleroderma citrinum Foug A]
MRCRIGAHLLLLIPRIKCTRTPDRNISEPSSTRRDNPVRTSVVRFSGVRSGI